MVDYFITWRDLLCWIIWAALRLTSDSPTAHSSTKTGRTQPPKFWSCLQACARRLYHFTISSRVQRVVRRVLGGDATSGVAETERAGRRIRCGGSSAVADQPRHFRKPQASGSSGLSSPTFWAVDQPPHYRTLLHTTFAVTFALHLQNRLAHSPQPTHDLNRDSQAWASLNRHSCTLRLRVHSSRVVYEPPHRPISSWHTEHTASDCQ